MHLIPRFSQCASNCCIAPALKVSPAAAITERPLFISRLAIFAAVVVFPVPLTPTSIITTGVSFASINDFTEASKSQYPACNIFLNARFNAASTTLDRSAPLRNLEPIKFVLSASITAVTASLEISDSNNTHSSSSNRLSSAALDLINFPPDSTTPPPSSTSMVEPVSVSMLADFTEPLGA